MHLNLIAYLLYFLASAWLIIQVGRSCHRNGNVFVAALIPDQLGLCHRINDLLLLGYYLLNLGYCAVTIVWWRELSNWTDLVVLLSQRLAHIVGIIAVLHYLNLFVITQFLKKFIHP